MAGALDDINVVDLSRVLAGPWSTQNLADLGADVIKIERPGVGDDTRSWGPPFVSRTEGDAQDAAYFFCANRNKRSLTLDFTTDKGREILIKLIAQADVLIENYKVGGLKKYGLDYDSLSRINPRLIYCSITGFGQDGPYADRPGYDALVQAVSGMMSFTGSPDTATIRVAPSILDLSTGMWTAMGLLAAILRRNASGGAEHIRPSLIDSAFTMMNHQLLGMLATGQPPEKLGSGAPSAAPYGVFKASDGELLIATASEQQFPRLCKALGLDTLIEDVRFRTMADRLQHREPLDLAIAAVINLQTVEHWRAHLGNAGISCGRVNDLAEALALPVVAERRLLKEMQVRLPIDSEADGLRARAPTLGEHSGEILGGLGYSEAEISRLVCDTRG